LKAIGNAMPGPTIPFASSVDYHQSAAAWNLPKGEAIDSPNANFQAC
jgi:hypothetical protein